MAGQQVSRLRKVALTGALTPVLILGAPGLASCLQAFFHAASDRAVGDRRRGLHRVWRSAAAPATEMSVADVARKVNPAVVTVLNLQPLSQADLSGFSGIEGIPGMPGIPNIRASVNFHRRRALVTTAEMSATPADSDSLVPDRKRFRVHRRSEMGTSSPTPMWSRAPRS